MTAPFEFTRWMKPESAVLLLFVVILAWMPFPFGSNRPWAELVAALGLGGVLLGWAGLVMSGVSPQTPLIRQIRWPALLTTLALAWGAFQSLDLEALKGLTGLDLQFLAHPVWRDAGEALGRDTASFISADPATTRQALVAALLPVMAFLLAYNLGRDRDRAALLLAAVVFIGMACAGMASASLALSIDLQAIVLPEARPLVDAFAAPFINPDHLGAFLSLAAIAAFGASAERFRQALPWDQDTRTILTGLGRSLEGKDGALLILGLLLLAALAATGSGVAIAGFLAGMALLMLVLAHAPAEEEGHAAGRRAVTALLFAVTGLGVALGGAALLGRFGPDALDPPSRQLIAGAALQAIAAAPLSGQGFGAFESYHTLSTGLSAPGTVEEAGNDLLEPLSDLGLPAGIAFLASPLLLVLQCAAGAATRRRDRVFPAIAVAAATCMGVQAVAGFSLQVPAISVAFAVLLGIGTIQSWRTNMDLVR